MTKKDWLDWNYCLISIRDLGKRRKGWKGHWVGFGKFYDGDDEICPPSIKGQVYECDAFDFIIYRWVFLRKERRNTEIKRTCKQHRGQ